MNKSHNPLFSIVMPSLNQAAYIGEAIESVLSQSYNHIELIVGDGGSTDETVEILKKVSSKDHRLRWTSTPDKGPVHALNNCFRSARGQFIGWLNSDDLYASHALVKARNAFVENPNWILCYGHGEHIDPNGKLLSRYPTQRPENGMSRFRSGCFICQPTVFFRTPLLTLIGDLNAELQTAFDYEYWIRVFRSVPERIGFIDSVLAKSRIHEECITLRMRETVALEGLALGYQYLGGAQTHWATTYLEEMRDNDSMSAIQRRQSVLKFLDKASAFLSTNQVSKLKVSFDDCASEDPSVKSRNHIEWE